MFRVPCPLVFIIVVLIRELQFKYSVGCLINTFERWLVEKFFKRTMCKWFGTQQCQRNINTTKQQCKTILVWRCSNWIRNCCFFFAYRLMTMNLIVCAPVDWIGCHNCDKNHVTVDATPIEPAPIAERKWNCNITINRPVR